MYNFPKIRQFKDVIRHVRIQHDFKGLDDSGEAVYEHTYPYPTLTFRGTVKLHGTNAGITFDKDMNMTFQSRTHEISVEKDNAGFAAFMSRIDRKEFLTQFVESFKIEHCLKDETVVLFMEFCGGNIQKGVALNQLDKMAIIFTHAKVIEDEENSHWLLTKIGYSSVKPCGCDGIFFIEHFPTFDIEIDFNSPEIAQNKIVEMVLAVESECPVCKQLGVSGIGEGIVFKNINDSASEFWFKAKGEKHSASKVKKIAAIDVEKIKTIDEFTSITVTENRLNQGLEYMKEQGFEIETKNTGVFLRWVVNDILSEELDLLTENDLCAKDVGKYISDIAKVFWFKETDKI